MFEIFEISKFVWWPEMADGRVKIGRKVRSKLFCHQKKFSPTNSKIHDFNLEKHNPPPLKKAIWGGGSKLTSP